MYANLRIKITHPPDCDETCDADQVFAWKVEVRHQTTIYLDDNNGMGNYAEPAGELVLDSHHLIQINPDF